MMRATLSALAAFFAASAACSAQTAEDQDTAADAPAETQTASSTTSSGFNLRIPGEAPTPASGSGFNLGGSMPAGQTSTGAFNIPAATEVAGGGLQAVPEIEPTDVIEEIGPAGSPPPADDGIIRLEPDN
ncbi:MAG: hypothetical protein AAFX03_07935 [Pseudomonadota bacterium]